jgi:hypothetical protein
MCAVGLGWEFLNDVLWGVNEDLHLHKLTMLACIAQESQVDTQVKNCVNYNWG